MSGQNHENTPFPLVREDIRKFSKKSGFLQHKFKVCVWRNPSPLSASDEHTDCGRLLWTTPYSSSICGSRIWAASE